ncbi:MAG: Kdo2-lipid lauroyltransferase/acyltransferase [Thermodesulfobacteriota bacterium]|nr:Kdo2-lipid lauroyltransferase/acyltransferase [Thermodesulfobacteriota bacterium]
MNSVESFVDINEVNVSSRFNVFVKNASLWLSMFPLGWFFRKFPITFSYRVAGLISRLAYLIAGKRRRILKEEAGKLFGSIFSEAEIESIIKRTFAIYLKRQVENIAFDRMTQKHLDRIISVEGWNNFSNVERKKKGVIILLAHFGSFLLPLPFLAYRGYRVYQIAGKPLIDDQGFVMRKIFEARKKQTDKMPFRFLLTDKYLGPVVRALKRGGVVVIAFDGRTGTEMIPMRLLNRTAQFSPGPFKLAYKSGATLLPTFVVRGSDNKHRMVFEPPIQFDMRNHDEDALMSSMNRFLRIFENYLLKYPCHFAMTLFTLKKEASEGLNPSLFID